LESFEINDALIIYKSNNPENISIAQDDEAAALSNKFFAKRYSPDLQLKIENCLLNIDY